MDKSRWLDFLSARLRSQISLENAEKAVTWAFALLALAAFGTAAGTLGASGGRMFVDAIKVLFLILFYTVLIFGYHLPSLLQKGEKPIARLLGIRDYTSLTILSIAVSFISVIVLLISHQVATGASSMGASNFLGVVAWFNDFVIFLHTAGCLFFLAALFFFPKALTKLIELGARSRYPLLGLHITTAFLLLFGYSETIPLGSMEFFEQFRAAGLYWIFLGSAVLLIGRLLRESSVPALAALELDVASGRLERPEDILARFKEAFVSRRLVAWVSRNSHAVASYTEKIARFSHEAMNLVSCEKPSEVDLNQVEDRYKRAEALHRKLEKESQRFLLSISLFDMTETERARIEELRDQFSRELRNAKLEVASVRKRIDEKLLAFKNGVMPAPSQLSSEVPVPVSTKGQTTSR